MSTAINESLLSTSELEQLQARTLDLFPRWRRAAASPYIGPWRSAYRGHGLELADLRPYQTGDDIRHMDWRATARSGKPTTKVFLEERQRNVHIVVDRGPTMYFGTRRELKATSAARIAAICAFAALAGGDEISGTIFETDEQRFARTRSLDGVLQLLRAVGAPLPVPDGKRQQTLAPRRLLHHLNRALEHLSIVILISDFLWLEEELVAALAQLEEHHDVAAFRVIDPAEEALVDVGRIRITSPLSGATTVIDTSDVELRSEYARIMAQRADERRRIMLRAGIRLTDVYTNRDPFTTLANAFRQ